MEFGQIDVERAVNTIMFCGYNYHICDDERCFYEITPLDRV